MANDVVIDQPVEIDAIAGTAKFFFRVRGERLTIVHRPDPACRDLHAGCHCVEVAKVVALAAIQAMNEKFGVKHGE